MHLECLHDIFVTDSALMENLARSVQSCKSLSLKSFMRIRGVAVPRPPYVDCGVRTAGASVRLELVSPDATFCAKPVCDLPVLKTPLSVQVASMHGSGDNPQASGSLFSSRTTGYLTLSKVRQAVLLMETDPDASVIPLVGIWVFVDSPAPEPGGTGSSLRENTLVWAACCRYIYSTLIRERVWVDENTFLMVCKLHTTTEDFSQTCFVIRSQMAIFRNKTIFYEVSASTGFGAVRPSFVCLDFTADINAPTGRLYVILSTAVPFSDFCDSEMTKSDPNNNYVIACRFRPLSNLACIEAFRRSLSNLESTRSVDPASWICPGSADFAPCIAEQTPMPRSLMAMPPPSPPSRHPATRPLEELPHQTQIIKLSLDVMDNGSCSEDGAIALQDNGSQYQQTIYRQAQELEAMRLEIAELTAKLNVNSTQPSAPIEAITHAKQAKKGKKKASRTATLDARGTEPIVSQLSNYLALSKLQKQIEPNPIIKTGN